MTVKAFLKNQRGFTIQEILTVLLVSSLLLGFCYSLFSFTHKLLTAWQQRTEMHSFVDHAMNILVLDVERAKDILNITDSTLTLVKNDDQLLLYRFSKGRMIRGKDTISAIDMSASFERGSGVPNSLFPTYVVITIEGKSNSETYRAEADLVIPQSGAETFKRSMQ